MIIDIRIELMHLNETMKVEVKLHQANQIGVVDKRYLLYRLHNFFLFSQKNLKWRNYFM